MSRQLRIKIRFLDQVIILRILRGEGHESHEGEADILFYQHKAISFFISI